MRCLLPFWGELSVNCVGQFEYFSLVMYIHMVVSFCEGTPCICGFKANRKATILQALTNSTHINILHIMCLHYEPRHCGTNKWTEKQA